MDRTRAERMAQELRGHEIGGWTVDELIGNGASALVFAAERNGQRGALKVVDPEMVERFGAAHQLERINRERELLGHGNSHIVDILDGGKCLTTGYLFLVMALLGPDEHLPLSKAIEDLPRNRIGSLIQQLAEAARFLLEDRAIVHRDIKPDNIMVTRDFGHLTLLDLGIALPLSALEDAGTGDAFVGTTRYSPPEFIGREEEHSPEGWRSVTFYQLGAVLHDMIMRRPLFDDVRAPAARVIDAVRHQIPGVLADDVDARLQSLARNCLNKDWRLRLRLVSWDSFNGRPSASDSVAIQERIQHRIATGPAPSAPQTRPQTSQRRQLDRTGAAVAALVRDVRQRSTVFPPIDVRHSVVNAMAEVSIKAGPWLNLSTTFEMCLRVEPLDNSGAHLLVFASAALGRPVDRQDPAPWMEIYRGESGTPSLLGQLNLVLHAALDSALEIGSPPAGGMHLPVLQGSC